MRRAAYLVITAFLASATTMAGCSSIGPSSTPEATPVAQAPAPSSTPGNVPAATSVVSWSLATRPVADAPYRTLAMKPATGCAGPIVTRDGRIILSCLLPDSSKGSDTGIFIIDPCSGVETLVVDPRVEGGPIGAGRADGDWLVYARLDAPQAIIARSIRSGERIEVGRIAAGVVDSPIGPAYAISGSRIAWADESLAPDGKRTESIVVFDLDSRTSTTVATLPPSTVADTVSLAGDLLVWSQTDVTDPDNVSCDVYSCLLSTGQVRRLSHDGRASTPCTNGAYVVWQTTYSRFASGGIYLYEVATGRGQEIASPVDGEAGKIAFGTPTIGEDGVTFSSNVFDRIPLYHIHDGTMETLATGGGRTYTAGHYIAWVGDTVTEKQDWYLLWADLSLPTPGATPGPLPCTPSALPGGASAAPATPATSPSPVPAAAGDVTAWCTYEDAAQGYHLRYPAGATIATDRSGDTTFTLTDNQATYTIRVGKRESPVDVDRPAPILETIHQNMGAFDISEIQEVTINGIPGALVAYSYSDPVQEPCSAQRAQLAYLLVGKQLYTLTFEAVGPDQCDATAVPLFEQMLHTFEPY